MKRPNSDSLQCPLPVTLKCVEKSEFLTQYKAKYQLVEDFLRKYECANCGYDISKSVRIEIESPHKILCYKCYRNIDLEPAVKYAPHDRLNFHMYSIDWTAHEELLLMQGLEKFGIDNWNEISVHIGSKTSKDCECHYYTFYYKSKTDKIPNNEDCLLSSRNEKNEIVIDQAKVIKSTQQLENFTKAHPEIQSEPYEKNSPVKDSSDNDFLGFNPLRKEFGVEYDNDAELLLSELEFFDEDKHSEKKMKFDVLDLYNQRINERIKRKSFVIERNLVDVKKLQTIEKRKNKREREIFQKIKMYMRFLPKQEFDEFLANLATEQELKLRIEELKHFK